MQTTSVFLIGGAPGVGKTTLACSLAAKLSEASDGSIASLTVDDLLTVAQTVTTPESHPGLHVMRKVSHLEYFTDSTVDQLKADAELQHAAAWPLVESLIVKHAGWAPSPIVIDGWHLRPDRVADLNLPGVWSAWIVIEPDVLAAREAKNTGWLRGSSNPERMLGNFLARSLWYNDLIRTQASGLGMNILYQDGHASVDDLCTRVLESIAA